jgi:hypothetical protein
MFEPQANANTDAPLAPTSGFISVRIGQLPGKIKIVKVPGDGCKVGTLVQAAELNHVGYEIRVDNQPANLETPVRHNQTDLLIRQLEGNVSQH